MGVWLYEIRKIHSSTKNHFLLIHENRIVHKIINKPLSNFRSRVHSTFSAEKITLLSNSDIANWVFIHSSVPWFIIAQHQNQLGHHLHWSCFQHNLSLFLAWALTVRRLRFFGFFAASSKPLPKHRTKYTRIKNCIANDHHSDHKTGSVLERHLECWFFFFFFFIRLIPGCSIQKMYVSINDWLWTSHSQPHLSDGKTTISF